MGIGPNRKTKTLPVPTAFPSYSKYFQNHHLPPSKKQKLSQKWLCHVQRWARSNKSTRRTGSKKWGSVKNDDKIRKNYGQM